MVSTGQQDVVVDGKQIRRLHRRPRLLVRRRRDATARDGSRPLGLSHKLVQHLREHSHQVNGFQSCGDRRLVAKEPTGKTERPVALGLPRGGHDEFRETGQVLLVDRVPMQSAVAHGIGRYWPFEGESEQKPERPAARVFRERLRGRREGERGRRRRRGRVRERARPQELLRLAGTIQGHSGTIAQVRKDDDRRGGGLNSHAGRSSAD